MSLYVQVILTSDTLNQPHITPSGEYVKDIILHKIKSLKPYTFTELGADSLFIEGNYFDYDELGKFLQALIPGDFSLLYKTEQQFQWRAYV